RLFAGGLFIPEIASQTLFSLTPGEVESRAVETLGPLAKYSALIGAVVANILLYGLISLLSLGSRLYNRLHSKGYIGNAIQSSVLAYVILLFVGAILFALAETDIQTKLRSIGMLSIYLILPNIAFGFVLCSFYDRMLPSTQLPTLSSRKQPASSSSTTTAAAHGSTTDKQTEIDYKKRQFLRAGIASAVALPILYFGLGSLISPRQEVQQSTSSLLSQFQRRSAESKPVGFEDPRLAPLIASEITQTELFYRIDKNPIVPVVMASTWRLTVKGLVAKPLEIKYPELRNMSSIEEFATLQ
ncbi:MAG: hypothetical protein ACJ72T_09055, partial [Nitrososphaeraceae archaeon]